MANRNAKDVQRFVDNISKEVSEKAYDPTEYATKEYVDETFEKKADVVEVVANPELSGDEPDLTGLQVGETKYAVPQGGGGNNGHTLTVQFSSVWENDSPASAQYQAFAVGLLKYSNGNVVTSIEIINDNNEHTFENVIAYTCRYAGAMTDGEPSIEIVSETGITGEFTNVNDNDNGNSFSWMVQLFTNSNVVGKYIIPLPA